MNVLTASIILVFFLLFVLLSANQDPAVAAGTIGLPLVLKARKTKNETALLKASTSSTGKSEKTTVPSLLAADVSAFGSSSPFVPGEPFTSTASSTASSASTSASTAPSAKTSVFRSKHKSRRRATTASTGGTTKTTSGLTAPTASSLPAAHSTASLFGATVRVSLNDATLDGDEWTTTAAPLASTSLATPIEAKGKDEDLLSQLSGPPDDAEANRALKIDRRAAGGGKNDAEKPGGKRTGGAKPTGARGSSSSTSPTGRFASTTPAAPSGPTTPYEQRTRCQDPRTLEFVSSATTCKNERPDRICALIFDAPDARTGKRDSRCNVAGMEDIADSCRKQCGICCEHIDYACEDDENQIIDCTKQLDKCGMLKWFDVLARFCAGSCGLCTRTECRDYTIKCREQKHLCLDQNHIDEMRQKCARTCGFCVVGPGGISENPLKRLPVPACIDTAANCTENEALCASPMHAEYMIRYCAKTCFKCSSNGPNGAPSGLGGQQVIVPVITNGGPELNGTAAVLLPASVIMNAASGAAQRGATGEKCEDHHPKCAIWVAKGFCTHARYTVEQRMALCPKSCKLC
ncbi:hypothetical protein M3Y99_00241700 [Aphelenchoides fujianensis]|nr:hypothetical protein M3Y99_00241700 [Aphelenchoides fujianensis]